MNRSTETDGQKNSKSKTGDHVNNFQHMLLYKVVQI